MSRGSVRRPVRQTGTSLDGTSAASDVSTRDRERPPHHDHALDSTELAELGLEPIAGRLVDELDLAMRQPAAPRIGRPPLARLAVARDEGLLGERSRLQTRGMSVFRCATP